MKRSVLILIAVVISFSGYTQNVIQSTDTLIVRFGERITLQYGLSPKPADTVLFPVQEINNDSLTTFPLEGKVTSTPDFIGNSIQFTAFDSGLFSFPALPLISNGDTLYTQKFQYYVVPAQIDTTQAFYDIKENFEVEWTFNDWLELYKTEIIWSFIGLAALVLLIIFGKKLLPKKKAKPVVEETIPEERFEEWIQKQLAAMHAEELWKQSDLKPFYSSLNYVLRKFLEYRYAIKTLEKTSSEINAQIKFTDLTLDEKSRISQSLNLSDMVKFAKENPTYDDNKGRLEWLEGFVNAHLNDFKKEADDE